MSECILPLTNLDVRVQLKGVGDSNKMRILRECSECEFKWYTLSCDDSDKCPMCKVLMYRVRSFPKLRCGIDHKTDDLFEGRIAKYESNGIS